MRCELTVLSPTTVDNGLSGWFSFFLLVFLNLFEALLHNVPSCFPPCNVLAFFSEVTLKLFIHGSCNDCTLDFVIPVAIFGFYTIFLFCRCWYMMNFFPLKFLMISQHLLLEAKLLDHRVSLLPSVQRSLVIKRFWFIVILKKYVS